MNEHDLYGHDVTVQDMLSARDARVLRQTDALARYGVPLISLTLNIAGPRKVTPRIHEAFGEAISLVAAQLRRYELAAVAHERVEARTGFEALWAVAADAQRLKRILCAIEDMGRFGRLLDIDVIGVDGGKVSRVDIGMPPRKCLICQAEASVCARNRTHPVEQLLAETERIIQDHLIGAFADRLAATAVRALLHEVAITPKPGLVDRVNAGAHADMDFFTFQDSAAVLHPYFRQCAEIGMRTEEAASVFPALRYPGMCAEDEMLRVTGGANTHKGAIFSLGILCGAAGYLRGHSRQADADALCGLCADMTRQTLLAEIQAIDGPAGARGEVAAGFPSVLKHGLPALEAGLAAGMSINDAGVYALLALMTVVEDANVARRRSLGRARRLMDEAKAVYHAFSIPAVMDMDRALIAENISPGGCADLLAVTIFLYLLGQDAK